MQISRPTFSTALVAVAASRGEDGHRSHHRRVDALGSSVNGCAIDPMPWSNCFALPHQA
jgi:hypothetical protein